MKIMLANLQEVIYRGAFSRDGEDKQSGRKYKSYFLKLDTPISLGEMPCTQEVFDQCPGIPLGSKVNLAGEYDTSFKFFRVNMLTVVK